MGEINKVISTTATVNINVKWILTDTEPATPIGYTRDATLDIDLGQIGKLWAFKAT